MSFIVLTYDAEAVCGSLDAMFGAFGPYEDYEAAAVAGSNIATDNGLDYEVVTLTTEDA